MDIPFSGFLAFKLLHKKGVKMSENTPIYPLFPHIGTSVEWYGFCYIYGEGLSTSKGYNG